jgi:type III secretion protein HrpB1
MEVQVEHAMVPARVGTMVEAINAGRLDVAEELLDEIADALPDTSGVMVFRVFIAALRGEARQALRELEALSDDVHGELKVLCLYLLGETHWQGLALSLEDSPDPHVRRAMKRLLGRPTGDEATL